MNTFAEMFSTSFDVEILSLESRIRTCARTVREWCEHRDALETVPTIHLGGWCAIAAANIWQELRHVGIDSEIHYYEGFGNHHNEPSGFHAFNVVDDFVVDITATQFPEFRNVPINIMHTREAEMYYMYNARQVFETAEALIRYQRKAKVNADQIAYLARMR